MLIYGATEPDEPRPADSGEYGECLECGSRGTEQPCWFCGGTDRRVTTPIIAGCEEHHYNHAPL